MFKDGVSRLFLLGAAFAAIVVCHGTVVRAAEPADTRIEEASFVAIGGIDQWITLRGANRKNPVLLIVHGGPGTPESPLIGTYEPYEQHFVVVQWDQRGAGKTFARNREVVKGLALEEMTSDGIAVVDYLRTHLKSNKVIVLGHSWGTILATEMVKRKPELFAAYVGTGQVVSWRASVGEQWRYLQSAAQVAQDQATLSQMQSIGEPDPLNVQQYFSWRPVLNRKYLGPADTSWLQGLRGLVAASPVMSETDIKAMGEGTNFSALALLKVMMSAELVATNKDMPVPFFIIQGKDDIWTPTSLAIDYFNGVAAPKKALTVIEGAGHFALDTHREEFIKALLQDLKLSTK